VSDDYGVSLEHLRLSFLGTPLKQDSKETFDDLDIKHNSNFVALVRLNGGAFHNSQGHKIDKSVQMTEEECILSLDDEDPTMKLPCGHAIAPNSLAEYVKRQIADGKSKLRCPTCTKEWKVSIIKNMGLTDEEIKSMEVGLSKNYFMSADSGHKKCPWCGLCIEKYNDGIRIKCPMCKKEFCWKCMEQWKAPGSGYRECGNVNCGKSIDFINVLLNCENTKMEYSGMIVPSVRACIGCGEGISHKEGCKHMTCIKCKTQFCFVCLKKWPCGSYKAKCKIAPRQATVPTK